MAFWLVKTEPETFSYADLERLGQDRWNGVRNFGALRHLRQMVPKDMVFIYHTGKEKAIVGVGEVVSMPYPDPEWNDPRWIVVDIAARYRLNHPVTLAQVKALPFFGEWELVKQPRLSVMPVKTEYWDRVLAMSDTSPVEALLGLGTNDAMR